MYVCMAGEPPLLSGRGGGGRGPANAGVYVVQPPARRAGNWLDPLTAVNLVTLTAGMSREEGKLLSASPADSSSEPPTPTAAVSGPEEAEVSVHSGVEIDANDVVVEVNELSSAQRHCSGEIKSSNTNPASQFPPPSLRT